MKFLVVGLGSMGKRRIRNVRHLDAGEVCGFDPSPERRAEARHRYGVETFSDIDDAMRSDPDALVISTPPDLHMLYAKVALEAGKHFFVEASVVDADLDTVIALRSSKPDVVAAPSCTMRFQPSIRKAKELVDDGAIGKVLASTYHAGQYLPDWHPWEDYRSFYVARRETGACREIVAFELVWMTWMLGQVNSVACVKGKVSDLEVDIDDVYQLVLQFKNGTISHILVDVVARVAYRTLRLLGSEGVIEWDASARQLRLYRSSTEEWEALDEPADIIMPGYVTPENMYIDEMRAFVDAVNGVAPYPYTLEEDRAVLDLLYRAENDSAARLTLSEVAP